MPAPTITNQIDGLFLPVSTPVSGSVAHRFDNSPTSYSVAVAGGAGLTAAMNNSGVLTLTPTAVKETGRSR